MPYRTTPFVNGQIYHIFNRGSEKRIIFQSNRDRARFLKSLQYYQLTDPKPRFSKFSLSGNKELKDKKVVEIFCYCLMPNHFHLLIRQLENDGISKLMSKFLNSYTKYFNTKYDRVGALMQGQFKAVLVESDEQFIHLSRYIHLNPVVSYIVKNLKDYPWSSYKEYIQDYEGFCDKKEVLNFFKTPAAYEQFVLDQTAYGMELELIKHKLIDQDLA